MKSTLSAVAIVVGLVLLAGSLLWTILFPPGRSWTDEKSVRLTELGNEATAIKLVLTQSAAKPSMHSGQNPAELKEKYDKIAAEYKTLHEEFVGINQTPKTAKGFLWWSGIAFTVAGAIIAFASRDA